MKHHRSTGWTRLIAALAVMGALVTMTVTTASAEVIDRIVAQVNDEIVTEYELEEAALPYLVQYGQNPQVLDDEERRPQILDDVLDDLVDRILIEQEAREMGIEVSEAQIEEWMSNMAAQQNMSLTQFQQAIGQYGIEYDDYRQIVHDNLLRMQMMQMRARGGGVSESDIDAMYRERFGSPDEAQQQIEVRHILLIPDEATGGEEGAFERAEELRQKIVDGEASFEELAEAHSQGPGADSGGNIGSFGPGELAASFEEAAFAQQVGQLSQPVATDFGVHLIEVLDSQEQVNPQVEQRRQQIHAELQEREMERQMDSYLETLRTRAFVDIRY